MPRLPRFAPAGLPQHVTQRGNFGQDVFFSDSDRRFYLSLLDRHSAERKVRIIAYCLMTNHVHLIVEPRTDDGLPMMMQCVQSEYARVANIRQDLRGHLWQHRFNACVMDETHLGIAMAYVEMNPVRAGMTRTATDYEWSSARAHTALARSPSFLHTKSFTTRFAAADWVAILAQKEQEDSREEFAAIRRATRLNEPLGTPDFIELLESRHARRLSRRKPGRPAKLRIVAQRARNP